jgi:hypothetical protein
MNERAIVESISGEYLRYRALAEGAFAQLRDDELCAPPPGGGNPVAVIVWHLGGNLASRFTDFLTSDGEKPWRNREEEFDDRQASRAELIAKWESGLRPLTHELSQLVDGDLTRTVTIRGQGLTVHAALHRSLSHFAYHVGQIVHIAKCFRGDGWKSLSIPRGGSDAYNRDPKFDRPAEQAGVIQSRAGTAAPRVADA